MTAIAHSDDVEIGIPEAEPSPEVTCRRCCGPFIFLGILILFMLAFPSKNPVYSVAVAGVEGLDPSALGHPTLSPVMNLTVHINNGRNAFSSACVPGLSTASVSYGDAFLGKGSVPEFCAHPRKETERVVTVWGQDVAVPRFLRERLAGEMAVGEAAVDVQVTLPLAELCFSYPCYDDVLVCKAKIGGGLSQCQRNRVIHPGTTKPDPSST